MKIINRKLLVGGAISLATAFFSMNSHAADGPSLFGKQATGKWIVGAKIGKVDPNIPEINNGDMTGIILGYEFDRPVGANGSSTFELEYLNSDEAGIDSISVYEADILNAFMTYRSAGDLYLKLKLGLSYADIEVNSLLDPRADFEEVSIAAGIGIGYRIGELGVIELEASQDSGEADLAIYGINAMLEF